MWSKNLLVTTIPSLKVLRRDFILANRELRQLPQFELLDHLVRGEEAAVDDPGHGEGPADDGADRGQEVVDRGPVLVVLDRDGVHVIPEIRAPVRFPGLQK